MHFELSPIKAMELAASRIPGAISLAQGIPSFPTPTVIKEFVEQKLKSDACDKYSLTIGLTELREEISLALQAEGLAYDPDSEVLVTAGSIEAITATILASTSPGDEILIPSPTYASYLGAIGLARCKVRHVALDEDRHFDFHIERMRAAIGRNTRAILYCSPNNPTGTVYSREKTQAIVDLAVKHDLTLIIDEVYKDFYYSDDTHFSAASLPEARDRVVRICSFSKAYAMTGWRVGYLHAPAERVRTIVKYHDAMVTCAPVISQYAALAALRFGSESLKEFQKEFRARRDYAIERLDALSHILDYQIPKATYFVFPRIKDSVPLASDSHKLAYDILEKAKVALVPGVAFGPAGESHLRINFGRERHELEEGLNRLASYLSDAREKKIISTPRKDLAESGRTTDTLVDDLPRHLVRWAARMMLRRTSPTIIGIAGVTGKTVLKRTLRDILGPTLSTRAGILSYNTDIGLPLSILNLDRPKGLAAKVWFVAKLFQRAFFGSVHERVLVLEYGVLSKDDAERLLRIAVPNWLIVSGLASSDPSVNSQSTRAGIETLAAAIDPSHILWNREDPLLSALASQWPGSHSVSSSCLEADRVKINSHQYCYSKEAIGESAKLATVAAVELSERLGISKEQIAEALLSK